MSLNMIMFETTIIPLFQSINNNFGVGFERECDIHWHPNIGKLRDNFMRSRDHLSFVLAKRKGVVPSSFFVTGISKLEDQPAGRGGFADVWFGWRRTPRSHRPTYVALKVLRVFDSSGIQYDTLHQVGLL